LKAAYEWLFYKYAPEDMGLHGLYRAVELHWRSEFKIWRKLRDQKTKVISYFKS
jgi:hypothetical protein